MKLETPQTFVTRQECDKVAFQNGFRRSHGEADGWRRYSSTTAQGSIWLDGSNWCMPWHGAGVRPMNIASGNRYRGTNVLTLWVESQAKGYGHSWGTFKQWQSIGARVRKGERGTPIVFWKYVPCDDSDQQTPRFILRSSVVFNAAQVDGHAPPQQVTAAPDRIPDAEAFIAAIAGLDLRFGGDRAYYNPGWDLVQIPEFRDFKTSHSPITFGTNASLLIRRQAPWPVRQQVVAPSGIAESPNPAHSSQKDPAKFWDNAGRLSGGGAV